jgi:hypothetical protein
MGLLDKLVNAVKDQIAGGGVAGLTAQQATNLRQALEPLNTAVAGLGDKAATFITEGTQETALLDLQASQGKELGHLLGDPGRLRWGFNRHGDKKLETLAHNSMANRAAWYASVDQTTPLDPLIRLGKVLAAADAGKSLEHPGAAVPDWLQYLVNDAVFASYKEGNRGKHDSSKERAAWDVYLIGRLLAHEGLDERMALHIIFERKGLDSYYHDRLNSLVNSAALSRYLREHADWVMQLPQTLSAAGRIILAKCLGANKELLAEFAAVVVTLAVDGGKTVRAEAIPYIDGIPQVQRVALLSALLSGGDSTQRAQAADLMARLPTQDSRTALEAALTSESSKPVQQALRAALNRLDAVDDAGEQPIPPAPPWKAFEDAPLGDEVLALLRANHAEMLQKAKVAAAEEAVENKTQKHSYNWRKRNFDSLSKVTEEDMRTALRILNGVGSTKDANLMSVGEMGNVVGHGGRLYALPAFGPVHLIRWLTVSRHGGHFWSDNGFQKWLTRQPQGSVDLRALADLLARSNVSLDAVARTALNDYWNTPSAVDLLPADQVWPFFMEHPEFIDEGLGLVAAKAENRAMELGPTLRAITTFPVLPTRWLPRLMELALGEGKTYRGAAQKALAALPDIGRRVIESLVHSKSEVRIEAAHWLAELRYLEAVPALVKALEKESRETVRAAFLTALEALGEDISPRLAPEVLLAEAKKGLKAKPPSGLDWFAWDALPVCHWANGQAVEPDVVRWWVVLACKLKEPGGNALLTRYLSQLKHASAQSLGSAILRQFITHDTRHPPLEEGIAYAQAHAANRYQSYQSGYLNAKPEYRQYYESGYAKSQDQVFEECKREKMAEYLGSTIGEKGILALAAKTPGHEVVTLLQQYMRDHYQRRSQIEAMLDSVAVGNEPVVIQLLLGLSRRYRTASVQEKARALVQEIAQRNGWTQDQLADRTIPTAGLDETGTLQLAYGDRNFTMVLDAAMKPELRNPEGKAVKALPEARQNDDPAVIKEAKTQFATSKKELKQVIDMQTARLFEAMCTGRQWPHKEWRDYLHSHPIVGRLIQRLVWLEVDSSGSVLQNFRPSEDGSLLNTEDDEVSLSDSSLLRLAHASLVDAETAKAWVRHFKDYKLIPLFAQMAHQSPTLAFADENGVAVTEIKDRQGWVSDTFTLRGAFTKLGYQRSQAEDGGFFYQYTKDFSSAGVRVVMEFSGNTLPEENVAAALKTLAFEDSKVRGWSDRNLALVKVPPVLLAEAYADYLGVAQACAGFDADWEKKMPW